MPVAASRLTTRVGGWYRQPLMETVGETSDGDLARAIAGGAAGSAAAAEGELYRRFAPRVRLYGLRHLRDEDAARDLTQQVMLLTIERLREGQVRDGDQIGSFILGVSRTIARDIARKERRRGQLREMLIDARTFVAGPASDAMLDLDRLDACLACLSERERCVVTSTFYAERTAAQVGKDLGLTEGNVRVIRHRAVERLRLCMAAHEAVQ
jgi:RNA polymerase sigma-70 factor (ECF subfamily)